MKDQIDKITTLLEGRESRLAWQTLNEESKTKSALKAKLEAANQIKRFHKWKERMTLPVDAPFVGEWQDFTSVLCGHRMPREMDDKDEGINCE